MDNEKQIVLFLKSGTTFNELQIAAKINERHPSLNSPMTIPYDENNPNNPLNPQKKGSGGKKGKKGIPNREELLWGDSNETDDNINISKESNRKKTMTRFKTTGNIRKGISSGVSGNTTNKDKDNKDCIIY